MLLAQPPAPVGDPAVNISIFGAFVLAILLVVLVRGGRDRSAAAHRTGGASFTGAQNGAALAGDHLSAVAFLGVAGLVAVLGHDGLLYAIGSSVAWLVALLLVAERLRNTGRYTMGDVLSSRLRRRPVRAAAATSTLLVSLLHLVAQIAGAGGLIALLLGVPDSDRAAQSAVIGVVGLVMVLYVLVGGMSGTTWVQILNANLLIVTGLVLASWVLGRFVFDVSGLLGEAAAAHPLGEAVLAPGVQYGGTGLSRLDSVSLALAAVLGPAGLPHVLMRFHTVRDAREARRSVAWAIWLIGASFLCVLVMGYGAMALVGPEAILAAPGASNAAVPLLAHRLGGELLLGIVAAVAFAAILAVVAGLTITASASFAHDVHANVLRRGAPDPAGEVRTARGTAVVLGVLATGGGILANGQNVAVLVGLAFAVAAAANTPSLVLSLFWRRFSTTGALWSTYGGTAVALGLVVLSPVVSGGPTAMLPGVDLALFPLVNPGIVAIPLSFLLGVVGTLAGPRDHAADARSAEMEVRALTGARTRGAVRRPAPRPTSRSR